MENKEARREKAALMAMAMMSSFESLLLLQNFCRWEVNVLAVCDLKIVNDAYDGVFSVDDAF